MFSFLFFYRLHLCVFLRNTFMPVVKVYGILSFIGAKRTLFQSLLRKTAHQITNNENRSSSHFYSPSIC